jgi:hypothetical protein
MADEMTACYVVTAQVPASKLPLPWMLEDYLRVALGLNAWAFHVYHVPAEDVAGLIQGREPAGPQLLRRLTAPDTDRAHTILSDQLRALAPELRAFTREEILAAGGFRRPVPVLHLDWQGLLGFEVERARGGRIISASIGGQPIEPAMAYKLLNGNPRLWWDEGRLRITEGTLLESYRPALVAAIEARLAAGGQPERIQS